MFVACTFRLSVVSLWKENMIVIFLTDISIRDTVHSSRQNKD